MSASAGTPPVTWTVEAGLAVVRLGGRHGNAINPEMVEGLLAAFREIEGDPSIRGAVLASAGKIFSPGLDLKELIALNRRSMAGFLRRFMACLVALYAFPKPLLAAVSGHALAGGLVLALTADWRVLKRGALVGLNEIRVGVPLPFGVAEILRASVPPGRLEEVALLGRNYADGDAIATGLVHELREAEGFEEHCRARLDELASKDPAAFARTKGYLRSATLERVIAGDASRAEEFLDCWFSEATRTRIDAIVADLRSRSR